MFEAGEVQVAGSEKARISEVRINSPDGHDSPIPLLKHGDNLEIFMKVGLNQEVEQAMVRVEIRKRELARGIIDIIDKDYKAFLLRNTGKEKVIKLTLQGIRLNAGIHHLFIVIADAVSGEILVRVNNVGKFQVSPIYASWTSEVWKGQWEILE
jgi:hypothetical protein